MRWKRAVIMIDLFHTEFDCLARRNVLSCLFEICSYVQIILSGMTSAISYYRHDEMWLYRPASLVDKLFSTSVVSAWKKFKADKCLFFHFFRLLSVKIKLTETWNSDRSAGTYLDFKEYFPEYLASGILFLFKTSNQNR